MNGALYTLYEINRKPLLLPQFYHFIRLSLNYYFMLTVLPTYGMVELNPSLLVL